MHLTVEYLFILWVKMYRTTSHWRSSSVNFGGKTFLPKNWQRKVENVRKMYERL